MAYNIGTASRKAPKYTIGTNPSLCAEALTDPPRLAPSRRNGGGAGLNLLWVHGLFEWVQRDSAVVEFEVVEIC